MTVLFFNANLSKFYILKINKKSFALIFFYICCYVNSYSYIAGDTLRLKLLKAHISK